MPRRLVMALALLGIVSCLCGCAEEETPAAAAESSETAAPLPPQPSPRPEAPYDEIKVYFDSLLCDRGYERDGEVFISPSALSALAGLELGCEAAEDGFIMDIAGLELSAQEGREYILADGRYLYAPSGWLTVEGQVYLPWDAVERLFSVHISLDEALDRADINTAGLALMRGGEDYYDLNFSPDDMYWLSRIIYAEAKDQPMAGLIGVGNVVLNRVESDDFPSTIIDVLYDREHMVQFDPVASGGVLGEPDERSVIAACLCLEGYNTVGDSLYFVNPELGDSSWFESSLRFVISIGGHDFYA